MSTYNATSKVDAELPETKPGEHLWIVAAMWRVNDPEISRLNLDHENMLTITVPGCYNCENEWSAELARIPCPGYTKVY